VTHSLANRETRTAINYALSARGIPLKVCSQCLALKSLVDFEKFTSASDGLRSFCRACRTADRARRYFGDPEYRAKHNARAVQWSKANPDRVRELASARGAARRVANASKVPDPSVMKRCGGRCGQLLPETAFRFDRGTRDGLRPTCRNCTADCRRRCRKAHGTPEGQTCYLCGEAILTASGAWVDHVVPRSKGGGDEPENLRWTHGGCNGARHNKPLTAEQMQRLELVSSAA